MALLDQERDVEQIFYGLAEALGVDHIVEQQRTLQLGQAMLLQPRPTSLRVELFVGGKCLRGLLHHSVDVPLQMLSYSRADCREAIFV